MIHVVPCNPDHFIGLESLAPLVDREMTLMQIDNTPGIEPLLEEFGRSLVEDRKVIACFGVWPMWDGVARAWADLTSDALNKPKTLHQTVMRELAEIEEKHGFRRVEAIVYTTHEAGHRWLRHLGFRREGTMRNYGIGGTADCDLYARVN